VEGGIKIFSGIVGRPDVPASQDGRNNPVDSQFSDKKMLRFLVAVGHDPVCCR